MKRESCNEQFVTSLLPGFEKRREREKRRRERMKRKEKGKKKISDKRNKKEKENKRQKEREKKKEKKYRIRGGRLKRLNMFCNYFLFILKK